MPARAAEWRCYTRCERRRRLPVAAGRYRARLLLLVRDCRSGAPSRRRPPGQIYRPARTIATAHRRAIKDAAPRRCGSVAGVRGRRTVIGDPLPRQPSATHRIFSQHCPSASHIVERSVQGPVPQCWAKHQADQAPCSKFCSVPKHEADGVLLSERRVNNLRSQRQLHPVITS